MIVIKIKGGLGNQLFQYALGEALKKRGKTIRYQIEENSVNVHSGLKLTYFVDDLDLLTQEDIRSMFYHLRIFWQFKRVKGLQRVFKYFYTNVIQYCIREDSSFNYKKIIELNGSHYLDGSWGRLAYFDSIRKDLKRKIILKENFYSNSFKAYKDKLSKSDYRSISVHVRRGDYLKKGNQQIFATLTSAYYTKAIDYFKANVANPKFFIFSDDIDWCKKNLNVDGAVYIAPKNDLHDYHDFELMRICDHNIIANSTFSWWAAYLGEKENKLVIAPEGWYNDPARQKLHLDGTKIPKTWVLI